MMNSTTAFSHPDDGWIALPSQVCIFVKSLHLLAGAWVATVVFLWIALDSNLTPASDMLVHAVVPALGLEALAVPINRWMKTLGRAAHSHTHEWERALAWTIVPLLLLLGTAALIVA
jgi:hypothetical protein